MSQFDFGTIDPSVKTGTVLASDLNSFRNALNSSHKGSSRPVYAQAGTMWANDATNPLVLYMFDGADDISIGSFDTTTNTFTPSGAVTTAGNQTISGVKTFSDAINEAEGAAIASAATINLGTATGNFVHVTGTATITAITLAQGSRRVVVFDGVLTLTNGANLILPGGTNITTAGGDSAEFWGEGSGVTRCVTYTRANGQALAGGSVAQIQPISASVGSNALTISASALSLDFRSTTLGNGAVTRVSGTPANLVISSGSTLGSANGVVSRIAVLAINNAGTIELAAVNMAGGANLDETGLITTVAEGGAGAADSISVIYSTNARSNVAYRVIGFIVSTQATAGTWATTPSAIQGSGGESLKRLNSICNGVAVASTSGTAIDFTGIPSWVKRITVMFNGVSTNGASAPLIQIGSGTPQTSGYAGSTSSGTVASAFSTGFLVNINTTSPTFLNGFVILSLLGSNVWIESGITSIGATTANSLSAGSVTLSGTLDRVRITTVNGTDTFDAGSINILYE